MRKSMNKDCFKESLCIMYSIASSGNTNKMKKKTFDEIKGCLTKT